MLEKSLAQLEKQAQIAQNQSASLKKIVSDIRAKSLSKQVYQGSVNNLLKKLSMKNKMMEHIYASREQLQNQVDW
jgi:hypothetical protein